MSEALQNGSLRGLSDLKYVFLGVCFGKPPDSCPFLPALSTDKSECSNADSLHAVCSRFSIRVLCHLLFLNSLMHVQQFVRVSVISQWICTQP